jgi:hypothetical protein
MKKRWWKEGEKIARMLKNGITYIGPQIDIDEKSFYCHLFNDKESTDTTFAARDIKEAKEKLIELRIVFKAPPPKF